MLPRRCWWLAARWSLLLELLVVVVVALLLLLLLFSCCFCSEGLDWEAPLTGGVGVASSVVRACPWMGSCAPLVCTVAVAPACCCCCVILVHH